MTTQVTTFLTHPVTGESYTAVTDDQAYLMISQGWVVSNFQPGQPQVDNTRYRFTYPAPIVASHPGKCQNTSTVTSDAGCTARSRHHMVRDATDIRLVYQNFDTQTLVANAVDVTATIEVQGTSTPTAVGTLVPVRFRGLAKATILPGDIVISDPIPYTFLFSGGYFWVNTHVVGVGGTQRPKGDDLANYYASWTGEWCAVGDAVDYTDGSYPAAAKTGFSRVAVIPTAILGDPITDAERAKVLPSVSVCGDSISVGFTDGSASDGTYGDPVNPPMTALGWQGRAFQRFPNVAHQNLGQFGESLGGIAANRWALYRNRLKLVQGSTHALLTLAMNDLSGTITATDFEALCVGWAQHMVDRGIRPVMTTPLAKSTSTDAWATAANQTPDPVRHAGGSGSKLELVRAWALTVPAPFVGCWDWSDAVNIWDASKNARIWRSASGSLTADGVHPNTAGHLLLAQAMPPFWTW